MQVDIEYLNCLRPGDILTRETCERLIGSPVPLDEYEYQFQLMILSKTIERKLHQLKRMFTVRAVNKEIRILSHAAASKYNERAFKLARAKMHRANKRLRGVNPAALTAEELQDYDKAIIRQGKILAAVRSQERVPLIPVTRTTPSMRPT